MLKRKKGCLKQLSECAGSFTLVQGSPNYDPHARSGPQLTFVWFINKCFYILKWFSKQKKYSTSWHVKIIQLKFEFEIRMSMSESSGHSHVYLFTYSLWMLLPYNSRVLQQKPYDLKYLLSSPLQKKFADPCSSLSEKAKAYLQEDLSRKG